MPSSVIQWMRYDPRSRSLLIGFRGRQRTYRYFDVPAREWLAFREAASKGTYLNAIFKEGGYGFELVTAADPVFMELGISENCWGELAEAPPGQAR